MTPKRRNMKKLFLLTVTFFTLLSSALAQNELDPATFYKFGNFDQALDLYLKEYPSKSGDEELNYRIAVCYLNTNSDKAEALKYIKASKDKGSKQDDVLLLLGQAYMFNHNFSDAKSAFDQYKSSTNKIDDISNADKHIAFCVNAEKYMANPLNVRFMNLGKYVNTQKSEFFPLTDYDEEFIVFNTNQRYIREFNEYILDIHWTNYKYGKWNRSKSVSSKINTTDYEYLAGAGLDLSEIFIMPDTYENSGDLFVSLRNNKRYENPVVITEPVNDAKSEEKTATISPTGDTLFFSSDREGGFGGQDIYYSLRVGGGWGIPQNMGEAINTPYNDAYPQFNPDGKFYFASEGHTSMGGYDVFRSSFNSVKAEWGKPENLGYPLNTVFDDYNIALSTNGRYGYVAQIQKDGFGEYDIYKVVFNDVDPTYLTFTGIIGVGDTASYMLVSESKIDVSLKVYLKGQEDEPFGEYAYSRTNGTYVISLPPGVYDLEMKSAGYQTVKERIVVPEDKHAVPLVKKDMFLTPPPQSKAPKTTKSTTGAK